MALSGAAATAQMRIPGEQLIECYAWDNGYGDAPFTPGFYTISSKNNATFSEIKQGQSQAFGGVEHKGRIYITGYDIGNYLGDIPTGYIEVYDAVTFEKLDEWRRTGVKFVSSALASDGENIYGCFYKYDDSSSTFEFCKLTVGDKLEDMERTDIIDMPNQWNACAFDVNGQLWAINFTGQLIKVDKATGSFDIIGATGFTPQSYNSAAFNPSDGQMYWFARNKPMGWEALMKIDTTNGKATQQFYYSNQNYAAITWMRFKEAPANGAPDSPSNLAAAFQQEELSGKIEFTMPTKLFNGEDVSGNFNYAIRVGDNVVKQGTAAAGEKVSVDHSVVSAGMYSISVTASNNAGTSIPAFVNLWIGNDTPVAPEPALVWADGKSSVSWDAVVSSVHKGYVDYDAVTYTVTRLFDNKVVAKDITANEFVDPYTMPSERQDHYYEVTASYAGNTSAPGKTNRFGIGPFMTPYVEDFNDENCWSDFTVIDVNGGNTWEWTDVTANNQTYPGAYGCAGVYNSRFSDVVADDWLISSPIYMEADKIYTVKVNLFTSNHPETFQLMLGTSPTVDGMTIPLIEKGQLHRGDTEEDIAIRNLPTPYSAQVHIAKSGNYYVGIHYYVAEGTEQMERWNFFADELKVSDPQVSDIPAVINDLTLTTPEDNAWECLVSFTTPDKNAIGETIETLQKIEIVRDGEVVHTIAAPKPGVHLEWNDSPIPTGGNHNYEVIAYNDKGSSTSGSRTTFIGFAGYPGEVTDLTLAETEPGKVRMTWTAPEHGWTSYDQKEEVKLIEKDLRYDFYISSGSRDNYLLQSGHTDTWAEWVATADNDPMVVWGWVESSAPNHNGGRSYTDYLAIGRAYETPFVESFANSTFDNRWCNYYIYGDNLCESIQEFDNEENDIHIRSYDNDRGFLRVKMDASGAVQHMTLPKIDLAGLESPEISAMVYNYGSSAGGDCRNTIEFMVNEDAYGSDWTFVGKPVIVNKTGPANQWNLVTVPLDEYRGKTLRVGMQFTAVSHVATFLDRFVIGEKSAEGIENIYGSNDLTDVAGGDGIITIRSEAGQALVADVAGVTRIVALNDGETVVGMRPGIYVVRVGNRIFKVVVR